MVTVGALAHQYTLTVCTVRASVTTMASPPARCQLLFYSKL